jgi:hypothetical protein
MIQTKRLEMSAGVPVADYASALKWYERLAGHIAGRVKSADRRVGEHREDSSGFRRSSSNPQWRRSRGRRSTDH